jgi:hypothetical protein
LSFKPRSVHTQPSPALRSAPLQRWAGALASLLALWHGAALLIGTAPPSYVQSQLMPLFGAYLRALHLDGHWAFFAPDPTAGRLLRYRVEQASGASTEQAFSESLRRSDPSYLRFTTLAGNLDGTSPALMHSVAQALCRRHAALAPRQIHFVVLQQRRITPEQVEAGLQALDPSLLERIDLGGVPCAPAVRAS